MNNHMFYFVILHYIVAEETINTVDLIINLIICNYKVIAVDNCSSNQSFDQLKNQYQNHSDVDIIQNTSNASYAKGINFGYDYALAQYSPNFVICMNNDMEIKQKDFLSRISKIYNETHFHVLGPDIYSTSACIHQNPEKSTIRSMNDVKEHIKQVKKIKCGTFKLKVKGLLRRNKFFYQLYKKHKKEQEDKDDEKHTAAHCMVCTISRNRVLL